MNKIGVIVKQKQTSEAKENKRKQTWFVQPPRLIPLPVRKDLHRSKHQSALNFAWATSDILIRFVFKQNSHTFQLSESLEPSALSSQTQIIHSLTKSEKAYNIETQHCSAEPYILLAVRSILYSYSSTGKLNTCSSKQKQAHSWLLIFLISKGQAFILVFKIALQNNSSCVPKMIKENNLKILQKVLIFMYLGQAPSKNKCP